MVTKTNGAEFKRFYNDPAFWPETAYVEDEELTVNGKHFDQYADPQKIDDAALMTIAGGIVYLEENDTEGPSFEAFFKKCRKTQATISFSVECDKEKLDHVKACIKRAGGRVI